MIRLVFTFFILVSICSYAQQKAYLIYSAKGKKVTYKKMSKDLLKTDIVLFGEIHNNPIAHWLTLELAKTIHKKRPIQIGLEMFENHQQELLDEYLTSKITEDLFINNEGLWSNFKTDYYPLINWAKQRGVKVNSTNITRKYATSVFKEGFGVLDTLSDNEKERIAPLPIPFDGSLPQYQKMLTLMEGHGGENLVKAQAIKDATMAHSISKQRKDNSLFYHVNGCYHSDFYEGIVWYLKQYDKNISLKTITTVEQKNIYKLNKEHLGKADFIICVPETMTKTY